MAKATFKLDLAEQFPQLSHAPIVEAVIHWQARAQKPLEPDAVRSALVQQLPEYRSCEPIQQFAFAAMMTEQNAAPIVQHQKGWYGFRLTSDDQRYVVQFHRDGIVFSRTQQYPELAAICRGGKADLARVRQIAAPVEIQRLGVRFIKPHSGCEAETLAEILCEPPTCPSNLPLNEFLYQTRFSVPDQSYGVRVIKVMQPSVPGLTQSSGLFLDCDVYTTTPMSCEDTKVDRALGEMRWLKNKIFFTLLTEEAINSLK